MFTGIVAGRGIVRDISVGGITRFNIDAGDLSAGMCIGGSIAINGACLTVVAKEDTNVAVEVMPETLARTNLGGLAAGDLVNLERPVGPNGLFEGHIVQGHIDGVAVARSVVEEAESRRVAFDASSDLLRYVVEKGSICLDGVSLTVSGVDDRGFEVSLIPHTLRVTSLGAIGAGDRVNVELDVIAKYVERLVR